MRRVFLITTAMLALLATTAEAGDVADTMTTQGVLRNAAGDVVGGVYQLTFKLYDAQENGQLLWTEVHGAVVVENGVYTAELGTVSPLGTNLFKTNSEVWLGISVEGEDELALIHVTTVAYAFNSRSALVAESAEDLNCTGCIEESMLAFGPVTQDNLVQSVKDSGAFVESADGVILGALDVGGAVTAAAFVGDGSGLSGISSPQGVCADGWFVSGITGEGALLCNQTAAGITSVDGLTGGTIDGDLDVTGIITSNGAAVCTEDDNCGATLAQLTCDAGQVPKWDGSSWVCSDVLTEFEPSALPADGLNEVSNDLLTNQFIDTYVSETTPTPIPDNNPTGVVDSIVVPNAGIAQELTVSINITNSDMATVKVVLFAPNNNQYVLYDKDGPGQELGASYPVPTETLSGDLLEWVDANPVGTWQLQVIDTGFKDNTTDGQINAWSIQVKTLSTKKVLLDGDLHVTGSVVGPAGLKINGNGEVTGSLKVGPDVSECNAGNAGTLRYQGSLFQWCNGNVWNTIGDGRAMFRWAQWSTYGQAHGWYGDNRAELFGGVNPSNWGDGNQSAQHVSSNSDVLRTLFWRKGPTIGTAKNAMVMADEWYYYSSTNSRHTAVLFRIRNTTDQEIVWTPHWYKTGYGGYNEYAGIALNGSSIWYSSANHGVTSESSHAISIPANRTSTVIFVAAASSPSGTRSNFLAFYNDSLVLPAGLEYVDDLDSKPDGWDN